MKRNSIVGCSNWTFSAIMIDGLDSEITKNKFYTVNIFFLGKVRVY